MPIGDSLPAWLADLNSIAGDLESAERFIGRYLVLAAQRPPQGDGPADTEMQALWNAAVIAYRRAWTTGRSLILPKGARPNLVNQVTAELSQAEQAVHAKLWEQANKHVAHRVANLEQARVLAVLNPDRTRPGIVGVATMHVKFIGPTVADAQNALALCNGVKTIVQRELGDLTTGLTSVLAQEVDVSSLYKAWDDENRGPSRDT